MQLGHRPGSSFLGSQILRRAGPKGCKPCPQQYDDVIKSRIVFPFPLNEVIDHDLVVRVFRTVPAYIDQDSVPDELSKRDGVQRIAPLEEVNGCVDVGAAM